MMNEDDHIKRLRKEQEEVRQWQTAMRIMSMNGFTDPLTDDIHFVIRAKKMMTIPNALDALAEAAEVLPSNKDKAINFLKTALATSEIKADRYLSLVRKAKNIEEGLQDWEIK